MASHGPDQTLDRTLARAARGDGEAWRALVEGYSPRVFGLLLRQCRDRDLAEEITQATFVTVVTHLARYQEKGRFEPWLFRIAMNRLRDEMRRRKRQARPIDMTPGSAPGAASGQAAGEGQWAAMQDQVADHALTDHETPLLKVHRAEQIDQLRAAIATMSEADQEILHLRHTAGLSFAEIAETLNEPLGTVLARGHRALGKLRKMMLEQERQQDEKTERPPRAPRPA
jgi:RNA polymerase sigma-70 factor, ECF subfamily